MIISRNSAFVLRMTRLARRPKSLEAREAEDFVAEHLLGIPVTDLALRHGQMKLERLHPNERYNQCN